MTGVVVWPASLPTDVRREQYAESPPDLTLRTSMDAPAIAKARRRATAGARTITVAYWLTRTQVATLDTFYGTVGGFASFQWTHPRTQTTVNVRFTAPPAFGEPQSDAAWPVTLSLEILP
jgi:hypothetical protein